MFGGRFASAQARNGRGGDQAFLTRLARDRRGNVLFITAAALIPLIGMVGSGIDMSRAYMARARLQQACDAGALAGRRAMTNGTVDATVTAEAMRFFRFNYPTGTDGVAGTAAFGTKGFTPTVFGSSNATVNMAATTTIPTTLMTILGFTTLPLSVTCSSKLDFVNTDIVLVLDNTGSMFCAPSEATCPETSTKVEKPTSKIVALRAAVLSLYDTLKPIQDQLANAGLRLRFSVVPYSSSVNVGRLLRGVDPSYVANDNWTYQSRRWAGTYSHTETSVTSSYCSSKGGTYTSNRSGSSCTYSDLIPLNGTPDWTYTPIAQVLTTYATGTSTPSGSTAGLPTLIPTRAPGTSLTTTWAGCIEERQTTNAITGTTSTIPAAAYDLDIDMVPTSDKATKWKPFWPEVEYLPTNSYQYGSENNKPQWACPAESRRLQGWTRDALSTYLDTLVADGGTYHDNGMRWGIRMLSGNGVFSADNPSTYGGMPVSKYIIFMTDGALDTGYQNLYTSYGIEQYDARVTPGGSLSNETDQYNRHLNRFNMLCQTAKNRGISVWVVAFAQALTTSLSACATNAAQASTSADQAALNARFVQIGQNIGALRLTQ